MTNIVEMYRPLFGSKKKKNQELRLDTDMVHSTSTNPITPPSSGTLSNSPTSITNIRTTRVNANTITPPESPVSPLEGLLNNDGNGNGNGNPSLQRMNSMNPMGGYRRITQSDIREMVEGADIQSPASAEFTEHVSEVVEDEEIGGAEKCAENVRPFKVGRKASFWRFKGKGDQRETDEVTPPVSGELIDGSNSRAPDEAIGVKIGPSGGFPWFKRKGSERGQEKDKAKTKQKEESEEIDKMSPTTPVFFNSPSWSSESTSNGKWKAKENENEEQRRRNKSEGEVGLSKEVREGGKEEKKGKGRRWTLPWYGRKSVIEAQEKESQSEQVEREREERNIANRTKYPDGVLDCVSFYELFVVKFPPR